MGYITGGFTAGSFTAGEVLQGKGAGLGDRLVDNAGNEYLWVTFGGTIANAGSVVIIDEAYSAVALSTANDARGDLAGVVPYTAASGEFGWVQVKGTAQIQVLASAAANTRLNTTATAGSLDDDGTAGAMHVQGIYLTTARAASPGLAPGVLNYPFIDATL